MTDRRTTIKWMLAAAATVPLLEHRAWTQQITSQPAASGYGTDPDLLKPYRPGDVWPLTLSAAQRRTAAALCDVILPDDGRSPGAESVGVVDFIDEWVSAPYPRQLEDRPIVIEGLAWMDAEALRRFKKDFAQLGEPQQHAICDDICRESGARPEFARAAAFFSRYRDLTVGAFYSTSTGWKDIGYVGNVPLAKFEGPPAELLEKLGLGPKHA
ncbi:MAG TPA: gluconate 2-dehydrogenase subunit 3 family protein [Steroidobacteraceae bacterium]|nr:gluconate 2-dehydrogenase subunit 3 family protein [Steroidobacteraceae bacterium]